MLELVNVNIEVLLVKVRLALDTIPINNGIEILANVVELGCQFLQVFVVEKTMIDCTGKCWSSPVLVFSSPSAL